MTRRYWSVECQTFEPNHRFLKNELRAKHRSEYRERRCMIPGKLKPLIPRPEKNSCANCPYPQCRDNQLPDLSWDEYVDAMGEVAQADPGFERVENRMAIAEAVKAIASQNPKFSQAIVLKEYYWLSVAEIADRLHCYSDQTYMRWTWGICDGMMQSPIPYYKGSYSKNIKAKRPAIRHVRTRLQNGTCKCHIVLWLQNVLTQ